MSPANHSAQWFAPSAKHAFIVPCALPHVPRALRRHKDGRFRLEDLQLFATHWNHVGKDAQPHELQATIHSVCIGHFWRSIQHDDGLDAAVCWCAVVFAAPAPKTSAAPNCSPLPRGPAHHAHRLPARRHHARRRVCRLLELLKNNHSAAPPEIDATEASANWDTEPLPAHSLESNTATSGGALRSEDTSNAPRRFEDMGATLYIHESSLLGLHRILGHHVRPVVVPSAGAPPGACAGV